MNRLLFLICLGFFVISSTQAQFIVKSPGGEALMKVMDDGRVGISLGTADPNAMLDIGGTLRIGTVNDLSGTASASVQVLDGSLVKKRSLPASIWDGDDNTTYTAGSGILIDASNQISAVDVSASNERPLAGNATAIRSDYRTIDVQYDDITIKRNTSTNELYVDALPASAGWTYYPASAMVIETSQVPTSAFFRWYDNTELGVPATAKAIYLHIAMSNTEPADYNLSVTEQSWTDDYSSLNAAIQNGDFLTATVDETRPATNAGIVKLNQGRVFIGLRGMSATDLLDFCHIKVMGYFE